ncbi:hypothetical protein EV182_000062 [Spiromyces aspiralis]|uniref:Uncharacterized protein n=1 Tax=Spiromyces aspiralis TaxID=68401 RepID=A0ACC1HVC9_9FUNG|nr:hypothetical protein EV182_000062 [Spiromyces aspiralis]
MTDSEYEAVVGTSYDGHQAIAGHKGHHDLLALQSRMTRLWCLKESVVKAMGCGLLLDLRCIEVTLGNEVNWASLPGNLTESRLSINGRLADGSENATWRVWSGLLCSGSGGDDDYYYALAWKCPTMPITSKPKSYDSVPSLRIIPFDEFTCRIRSIASQK